MININIQYVKQAKKIITEYHSFSNDITILQDQLVLYKNNLLEILTNLNNLEESEDTDLAKKQILLSHIDNYEINVNKLQKQIEPLLKKLETVKKDSHTLYKIIMDKYPGYTEEELQKQLFQQMEQL